MQRKPKKTNKYCTEHNKYWQSCSQSLKESQYMPRPFINLNVFIPQFPFCFSDCRYLCSKSCNFAFISNNFKLKTIQIQKYADGLNTGVLYFLNIFLLQFIRWHSISWRFLLEAATAQIIDTIERNLQFVFLVTFLGVSKCVTSKRIQQQSQEQVQHLQKTANIHTLINFFLFGDFSPISLFLQILLCIFFLSLFVSANGCFTIFFKT